MIHELNMSQNVSMLDSTIIDLFSEGNATRPLKGDVETFETVRVRFFWLSGNYG